MEVAQGQIETASVESGDARHALLAALSLAFVCLAFSAAGSIVVAAVEAGAQAAQPSSFFVKLAVKTCFFTVAASACAYGLWRLRLRHAPDPPPVARDGGNVAARGGLLVALALMSLLLLPRLTRCPDPMPDEVHHLVVARNIAEHGLYASGNPEAEFKVFDSYDSVGPPVLLPIAAAFRLFGTGFTPARVVMGLYCLLLLAALYLLLRTSFGGNAAVVGILLAGTGWGTVYLGRALYGEAPALFFVVVGLTLWRMCLRDERPVVTGLLAGVSLGLAILCKYYMVMTAWAFMGAWVYDRVTFRAVRWRHVAPLAAGAVLVLVVWATIQHSYRDVVDNASGQVVMYKGLLLFGLDSPLQSVRALARVPVHGLVLAVGMVLAVPVVMRRTYDPATVTAYVFAAFVMYWWIFFTNGHIMRYAWYGLMLCGAFAGAAASSALQEASSVPKRLGVAALAVTAGVLIVAHGVGAARWVYAKDEMRDTREFVGYVSELDPEAPLASTYWPAVKLLDFACGRHVRLARPGASVLGEYRVIIVHGAAYRKLHPDVRPAAEFGRYMILNNPE